MAAARRESVAAADARIKLTSEVITGVTECEGGVCAC
jgi:hypothetical protein